MIWLGLSFTLLICFGCFRLDGLRFANVSLIGWFLGGVGVVCAVLFVCGVWVFRIG